MIDNDSTTVTHSQSHGAKNACTEKPELGGYSVNPMTLLTLDFGVFTSLCRLGTANDRICSTLSISRGDYDYIRQISNV